MPISRKPRAKPDNEETFQTPVAQIFEDVDNEEGRKTTEEDDRIEQMAKQLADMQNKLTEMNAVNMQLMLGGAQGQSQVVDTWQPQDPNKVKLPDPALDPEAYDAALAERQRIRAENERQQADRNARRNKSVEERANALQAAFAEKYPEMAENEDRMAYVTGKVAADAAKKGLDLERYMFLNQPKFIEDVADRYVKVFGDPAEKEGDEDYLEEDQRPASRASTRRRSSSRNRQEDDEGRSAGIFGGNEGGGRPNKGRRDDDERNGGDLISDLQEMQRKTGFW